MSNNVVIKRTMQSFNIDALNRTAKYSDADLPNGSVVVLTGRSTADDEGMVWIADAPTDSDTTGVWMVHSPEVVVTVVGDKQYKGLSKDPRDFTNIKNKPMDVCKLQVGDIIEMTGDGIDDIDDSTSKYLILDEDSTTLVASTKNTKTVSDSEVALKGLILEKIGTGVLHLNTGSLAGSDVKTYIYEVKQN